MENKYSVNADDYIAINYSLKKYLYDKNTNETTMLARTVFEKDESGSGLIDAKNNILYYVAIDEVTGGSAIYAFHLDTLEKKKIDTKNEVSNYDAFLGTENVLGINAPGNDIMGIMIRDVWINERGRHDADSVGKFLSEKDTDGIYNVSDVLKICTVDDYIFFINELSSLFVYSYNDDSFKKLSDDRIIDFFITENNVYYYSADEGGKLFVTDFKGNGKKYVSDISFSDIHVRNKKVYAKSENGGIYEINNEECNIIKQNVDSAIWDIDGTNIYVFNGDTKKMEVLYS